MVQKFSRYLWLTLVLVTMLALAVGCQGAGTEPPPSPTEAVATAVAVAEDVVTDYPLAATAWELDYFGPPADSVPLLPETRASVNYLWDRYAGFDGCNWFMGVYAATIGGDLRMMTPARTLNVCEPEAVNEQSTLYDSALLNVVEYAIEGEQLIANTTGSQRLLTYSPAAPVPMPGTEWELKFWGLPDDDQWSPVLLESMTTIVFGETGEASGSGGCNTYTVSYEGDLQIEKVLEATDTYAELPTLNFGPIASQMVACAEPEDIMDQEQGFFIALGEIEYYLKLGGMMIMFDADGMPLLMFGARN